MPISSQRTVNTRGKRKAFSPPRTSTPKRAKTSRNSRASSSSSSSSSERSRSPSPQLNSSSSSSSPSSHSDSPESDVEDSVSPPSSPTTTDKTSQYKTISASDLQKLISESEKLSFLLLDCRREDDFKSSRINFSVHVSLDENDQQFNDSFQSKADVIKYFLRGNITASLRKPGFYKNIIVLCTEDQKISRPETVLFQALSKWNECTQTKLFLLEKKGFSQFSSDYPNLLVINILANKLSNPGYLLISRRRYRIHLESAFDNTIKLILARREKKSLQGVETVLLKEQDEEITGLLNNLPIPEQFKCPVHLEIFAGEIHLCRNGHNICSDCLKKLKSCPECRLVYSESGGTIRNRALEGVISTMTVECPCTSQGCNQRVTYDKITSHVRTCGNRRTNEIETLGWILNAVDERIKSIIGTLDVLENKLAIYKIEERKNPDWNSSYLACIKELRELLHKAEVVMFAEVSLEWGEYCDKNVIVR